MRISVDTQADLLTEAQNAAIYTIDRSLAVVAGAGSGKTTVLINRCSHIIGKEFSEIDHLMAITFTEKAAGELKSRLRPRIPPTERFRLESAWIGTFHSCCARMLRQHAPLVALDPAFAILDENASRLLATQVAKNTLLTLLKEGHEDASLLVDAIDFKTAQGAIEDMLAFRWHAGAALREGDITDIGEERILKNLRSVWTAVGKNLAQHFERLGALDFQALEIKALELLDKHPDVLGSYQKKFKHLLVDEFQDTNDLQTEFVMRLFDPRRNKLCIVGDPRQSIYRFRGANIECFTRMLAFIGSKKGDTIDLRENFRSAPGVVNFVNRCQATLADGLFGSLAKDGLSPEKEEMIAARREFPEGPRITKISLTLPEKALSIDRREAEAEAIASHVREIHEKEGIQYGDIVCLFQALTGIGPYERAFRIAGIPYLVSGGRGLLERQEVSDLLAALRYAADHDDEMAILEILRSPLVGLSDDELVLLAGEDGKDFVKNTRTDKKCALLRELEAMSGHLRPSEILNRTISLTGFEEFCRKVDPSGGMTANIDRFVQIASSIERQEPTPLKDYASFIKELKVRSARIGDPPAASDTTGAIRCMTVHAAKGLEFPVVVLPDLFRKPRNSGGRWQFTRDCGIAFKLKDPSHPFGERIETERFKRFKSHEKESSEAESKRLLYVAMTRAKDTLVLPTHLNFKGNRTWHDWLMPIIQDVHDDGDAIDWRADGKALKPETPRASTNDETVSIIDDEKFSRPLLSQTFTVSQLECYYRCPEEYRLRYAFGLPANEIFQDKSGKLPANVFGSIVHGILDGMGRTGKPDRKTLIEKSCIENGVLPNDDIIKEVMRAIARFEEMPISSKLDEGLHELRFDYMLGKDIITGSIDWLRPSGGGNEVIDFKTDRISKGEEKARANEYDLQLVCYALAAETAMSIPTTATSLLFLSTNTLVTTEMNEDRKSAGLKLAGEIIENIKQNRFEIGDRNTPCFKCPYKRNGMCAKSKEYEKNSPT